MENYLLFREELSIIFPVNSSMSPNTAEYICIFPVLNNYFSFMQVPNAYFLTNLRPHWLDIPLLTLMSNLICFLKCQLSLLCSKLYVTKTYSQPVSH